MGKNFLNLRLTGALLFLLLGTTTATMAQTTTGSGPFKHWGVGVEAGLYGFGVQGVTSLSSHFQLRAGFDFLTFAYNDAIEFDAPIVLPSGTQVPDGVNTELYGELRNSKLQFPNGKLMVDFYPVKNGIFSLTAGFYVGNNKVTTDGLIPDYAYYADLYHFDPEFEFQDVTIRPNTDGTFDARLRMGNVFKPYVGIGLGKSLPKSRLGFRFELGVVFQGTYTVSSSRMTGTLDSSDLAANFDLPFSQKLLDYWPMMNFALTYRIR